MRLPSSLRACSCMNSLSFGATRGLNAQNHSRTAAAISAPVTVNALLVSGGVGGVFLIHAPAYGRLDPRHAELLERVVNRELDPFAELVVALGHQGGHLGEPRDSEGNHPDDRAGHVGQRSELLAALGIVHGLGVRLLLRETGLLLFLVEAFVSILAGLRQVTSDPSLDVLLHRCAVGRHLAFGAELAHPPAGDSEHCGDLRPSGLVDVDFHRVPWSNRRKWLKSAVFRAKEEEVWRKYVPRRFLGLSRPHYTPAGKDPKGGGGCGARLDMPRQAFPAIRASDTFAQRLGIRNTMKAMAIAVALLAAPASAARATCRMRQSERSSDGLTPSAPR